MTTIVINAQNVYIGGNGAPSLDSERLNLIMETLQDLVAAIDGLEQATSAEIAELQAVVDQVKSQAPAVDFTPIDDRIRALSTALAAATDNAKAALPTAPADTPPADPGAGDTPPPADAPPADPGAGQQPTDPAPPADAPPAEPGGDTPPADQPPADAGGEQPPADPGAGDQPTDPGTTPADAPPADPGTV